MDFMKSAHFIEKKAELQKKVADRLVAFEERIALLKAVRQLEAGEGDTLTPEEFLKALERD